MQQGPLGGCSTILMLHMENPRKSIATHVVRYLLAQHLFAHPEGRATTCFFEAFIEGSLKEGLLRRVLRRLLARVSVGTDVLRRVLSRGSVIEGAWKVLRRQKHA